MTEPDSSIGALPEASSTGAPGMQLAGAAALGLLLLYLVAFAPSPMLHNAAHDVRHVAATPCH